MSSRALRKAQREKEFKEVVSIEEDHIASPKANHANLFSQVFFVF